MPAAVQAPSRLWPRADLLGYSLPKAARHGQPIVAESVSLSDLLTPDVRPRPRGRGRRLKGQISVCSDISRASSTSMPRYRTVDSSFECPSSSCTARRFFVRR